MSTLAVVGTFAGRHENTGPLLRRVLDESTRPPDEFWVMCEAQPDWDVAQEEASKLDNVRGLSIVLHPTPRSERPGEKWAVIPYSNKINRALDESQADLFVYLDNNSMPHPEKYARMAESLEGNSSLGGVYCTQKRTGFSEITFVAEHVIYDAFCMLNYTQVMHRRTDERWTLDMKWANPDLADALFWRQLHRVLGPFYPAGGHTVLDEHHIPSPVAVGL